MRPSHYFWGCTRRREPESVGLDYPDKANKADQSPRGWLHLGGGSTASRCKVGGARTECSTDKASTNVTNLLNELEGELQKELKSEKGSKILDLLMKTARAVLAATGVPGEGSKPRSVKRPKRRNRRRCPLRNLNLIRKRCRKGDESGSGRR